MSSAFPSTAAAVLVVDDENETATLLRDLLNKRGYRADAVMSGTACLEYLRDNPVDVVVADVQMPGMSGIELCEHLYVRYPDVATIVLTGYGRLDTAIAAIRAGAYDFLTKPTTGDALRDRDRSRARALHAPARGQAAGVGAAVRRADRGPARRERGDPPSCRR